MVNVSKRRLHSAVMSRIVDLVFQLVCKDRSKSEFETLFKGIFSPKEQVLFAKRVAVLFLIAQKIEWRHIMDTLQVSSSTVSRCQMIFENNGDIRQVLTELVNRKDLQLYVDEFIHSLFAPGTLGVNWSSSWRRQNEIERRKQQGL